MKDKAKRFYTAFIAAAMVLCLIPLVCMTFARTDATTEKKELAAFPSLTDDGGKLNIRWLSQLGDYFNDHFAFRQQLVSADSTIRGRIFGVSTVDSVVVGRDGWLFYSDTLADFTGSGQMTDRELFNIANNLAITQRYVEDSGAKFMFTIAPNKNTLYPQHMPYTLTAAPREQHNAERLKEKLDAQCVSYTDLFALFDAQDEELYLMRDSHWNGRGAQLVCNELLSAVGRQDAVYSGSGVETDDCIGDLNSMLYPLNSVPETDIVYDTPDYEITNGAPSVESAVVVTSYSDAPGSLLMYRDSFGNSMLPFMAGAFGSGCFIRSVPYNLGLHMALYQPDTVIIEKVERSIDELAQMPAVIETPDIELEFVSSSDVCASVTVCEPEENMMFWRLDGVADETAANADSGIFVRVTCGDGWQFTREAFTVSTGESDFGYRMYISKDALTTDDVQIEVIAQCGGVLRTVCTEYIDVSTIETAFE